METVTITFSPNSPFAANVEAFLKTVPRDVKVSKSMKPVRRRLTKKERFLSRLVKAAKQAEELASKPHESYSTSEELIASIFDD